MNLEWNEWGCWLLGMGDGSDTVLSTQRRQLVTVPRLAPPAQVRRAYPLSPQQGADLARLGAGIGFLQYAQLLSGREAPPFGHRHHFRIGISVRSSPLRDISHSSLLVPLYLNS